MSDEIDRTPITPDALECVQQMLTRFAAAPARIDRDRLMFLAGRASAEGSGKSVQGSGDGRQGSELSTTFSVLSTECPAPGGSVAALNVPHQPRRHAAWLWPAATSLFATTSLVLLVMVIARPPAPPAVPAWDTPSVVAVAEPSSPNAPPTRPAMADRSVPLGALAGGPPGLLANNYLRTRDVALRIGVEGLGLPREGEAENVEPADYGRWRRLLRENAAVSGSRPSLDNSSL